jgi:hypothetical protein
MRTLTDGLKRWLGENGHLSVSAIRGLKSVDRLDDVGDLLRAQYMTLLAGYLPGRLAA